MLFFFLHTTTQTVERTLMKKIAVGLGIIAITIPVGYFLGIVAITAAQIALGPISEDE